MPKDEFDFEDPLELVGCEVPLQEETLKEMAACFVEEFARLGYGAQALFDLFRNPCYRGPHSVYQTFGGDYVGALIEKVVGKRPIISRPGLVVLSPLSAAGKE